MTQRIERQFPCHKPGLWDSPLSHSQSCGRSGWSCWCRRSPCPPWTFRQRERLPPWTARVCRTWPTLTWCPAGRGWRPSGGDLLQHFSAALHELPLLARAVGDGPGAGAARAVYRDTLTGSEAVWAQGSICCLSHPWTFPGVKPEPSLDSCKWNQKPVSLVHSSLLFKVLDSLLQGLVCVSWSCVLCWWVRSGLCKFW